MPYKDPEKKKEYLKQYYKNNKEKIKEAKNINKEKHRIKQKQYEQSERGKKFRKINDWKRKGGMKIYDENIIYQRYINTENCELCNKIMTDGNKSKNRKCLDHDHLSGYVRFVCCHKCNNYLQIIDNRRMKLHLELHRYFYLI